MAARSCCDGSAWLSAAAVGVYLQRRCKWQAVCERMQQWHCAEVAVDLQHVFAHEMADDCTTMLCWLLGKGRRFVLLFQHCTPALHDRCSLPGMSSAGLSSNDGHVRYD